MQKLKRERCAYCGKELAPKKALKRDDKLICGNWDCILLAISEREYNDACQDFAELFSKEFREWITEIYFDNAREEDVEYYEEVEC